MNSGTQAALLDSKMLLARMRVRLYLPGVLLAVSCSAVCTAQLQSPAKNRFPVTGTVVNSITGEPIRRALVRSGSGDLAFTGADGRFQMDLPEGQAFINAQKPGFSEPGSPRDGIFQLRPFTVGPGKNDIVLKLAPEATIQGRVVDSDGEPIEGVQVQLTMEQIANGRKELQLRQSANTNDDGTYRIGGLTPSAYLVHTAVHPVFTVSGNAFAPNQFPAQIYPQEFYPGSLDVSGAQPIELKPGQEAQVDFTLSPVRAFRVSGSVAGAQNGAFVSVEDAEGQQMFTSMNFDQRTGRFVLPNVPSGSWTLRFGSPNNQGNSYEAEK